MRKLKNNMVAYGFLSPAMISILVLTCLPIAYTVFISFTNYNLYHIDDYNFVGFDNYTTILSSSLKNTFFPVLGWTVCFAILSTLLSYFVGMGLAILLNSLNKRESKIYRTLLIIPWALPATIAILSWQGLLNEQYGGINNLLAVLGDKQVQQRLAAVGAIVDPQPPARFQAFLETETRRWGELIASAGISNN